MWRKRRLSEFADVCARDECSTGAQNHNGRYVAVADRLIERILKPFAHCVRKCINRGIVDRD